jgi:tubulin---tyrosine ligase
MSRDSVLPPFFCCLPTKKFSTIEIVERVPFVLPRRRLSHPYALSVQWDCQYTESIVREAVQRRPWCTFHREDDPVNLRCFPIQFGDFEHLTWELVMKGDCGASSYLVRKGLSRKAQLALQLKRYLAKNPTSILLRAVPETYIIETWSAFEDMKLDLGGGMMASFDDPILQLAPLRQRLDWALTEVRALFIPDVDTTTGEALHLTEHTKCNEDGSSKNTLWILKPSVTNKGANISIVRDWDGLLDALEDTPDMREWVLQKYLPNPLLVNRGHKFHLRVYVLCVGALRVFVFEDILMLIAAHK